MKTLLKFTLISSVLTGAAVGTFGTSRLGALWDQVSGAATSVTDAWIDDHVRIERELRDLQKSLPTEIDELESQIVEIDAEIAGIESEALVARRVVELARADVEALEARSEAMAELAGRFTESPLAGAERRRDEQRQLRAQAAADLYSQSVEEFDVQVDLLSAQKERIQEVLELRQAEFAELQRTARLIESELDAIERNERLITWCEDHETEVSSGPSFEIKTLHQLRADLERVRGEQSDALARLSQDAAGRQYESVARGELIGR